MNVIARVIEFFTPKKPPASAVVVEFHEAAARLKTESSRFVKDCDDPFGAMAADMRGKRRKSSKSHAKKKGPKE